MCDHPLSLLVTSAVPLLDFPFQQLGLDLQSRFAAELQRPMHLLLVPTDEGVQLSVNELHSAWDC